MTCAMASFDDRRVGVATKRVVTKTYNANTNVYLCPECDKFHVVVEVGRYPVSELWQKILCCLAQGMNRHQTAQALGIPVRTVDDANYEMRKRFYALNAANLVAIAIALGIVDPNAFVPPIEEKKHHAGS